MKTLLILAVTAASIWANVERGFAKCVLLIKEAREQMASARLSKQDQEKVRIPMKSPPIPKQIGTQSEQSGSPRNRSEATLGFCT